MSLDRYEILKSELEPREFSDEDQLELSADKLQELGKDLSSRFEKIRSYRDRATWEEEKAEALRAYHLEAPDKAVPYEGAANLRCIFTRIACDSLHANHMYAIFGQGNQAKIKPHYLSKDFKGRADRAADFLTYQLAYEADFYSVLDDASRKEKIYGIAYLKPRYERQVTFETCKYTYEEEVPDTDEQGNVIGTKKVKKTRTKKEKRVIFDGVKIDSLPIESVYISPFLSSIDEAVEKDVLFEVTSHTLETIKRLAKEDEDGDTFYIPSQVDLVRGIMTKRLMDDTKALEQARRLYDGFTLGWYIDQTVVELAEAHYWKDIDNDGKLEKLAVVFETRTGVVIRVSLAPCRIVEVKSRPVDQRFYGESLYRAIKPLCDEWEAIHNARVNAGAWENTVFGFYRAGGRFNPETVQIVPGHFYPVDDPREVQFAPTPAVRQSYFQEEGLLLQYVERILGITDNIQGLPSSGEQTATESMAMNQRASIRLTNPLNRIILSLEKLLNHVWDLNRQCAPETKEYYVVGIGKGLPLFNTMKREDFAVQTKFKLEVQNIFDQQQMQQTWLMAFKMFSVYPPAMNNPVTSYELFKSTLQAMNINITIPKPSQADQLTANEVIELIDNEKPVPPPMPGVDTDEYLAHFNSFVETEQYDEWTDKQKKELLKIVHATVLLKQTLEKFQLNKSGIFDPGPNMQPQPPQPGLTVTPNPTQTFNTLRAGETGPSMQRQPQNGVQGAMQGGRPQ